MKRLRLESGGGGEEDGGGGQDFLFHLEKKKSLRYAFSDVLSSHVIIKNKTLTYFFHVNCLTDNISRVN